MGSVLLDQQDPAIAALAGLIKPAGPYDIIVDRYQIEIELTIPGTAAFKSLFIKGADLDHLDPLFRRGSGVETSALKNDIASLVG